MSFNESRHKNTYIDKKINEVITALLNEMEVLVDNTHDEDVTLPQLLDRLYNRVITNTEKITEISSGGGISSDNVKFFPSMVQFPKPSEAKENVVYICKNDGSMFLFNYDLQSYVPTKQTLTIDTIQSIIKVINGGTATTVF